MLLLHAGDADQERERKEREIEMRVIVRIRPLQEHETGSQCVVPEGNHCIQLLSPLPNELYVFIYFFLNIYLQNISLHKLYKEFL